MMLINSIFLENAIEDFMHLLSETFLNFFFFSDMDRFKVFIEFVTILPLFYVWLLGLEACGILTPRQGIQPASPALEGEDPTTGPPGRSLIG